MAGRWNELWPSSLILLAAITTCLYSQSVSAEDESPFRICVSKLLPIVDCDPSEDQKTYTGYHIHLVRKVMERLDIKNYTLDCRKFEPILDDLMNDDNSTCDMVASAITRSTERQDLGILFTYPTYRSTLGIMSLAWVNEGSNWGFLRPLHWSVWVAMIVTSIAVPWLVFVIESLACHGFVHKKDWMRGLRDATYHSFAALLNFGHFRVRSTAARVVVLAYAFTVLIIINTYVANLAAFLTITQVDTLINDLGDLSDLPAKRVATVQVYEERLKGLGITPEILPQVEDYQAAMIEGVRAGEYKAIVMDEPWVSFTANTGGCDLKMLPQTFEYFDYAFAFPKTSDHSLVNNVSNQVLELQENGVMYDLARKHIFAQRSNCSADSVFSEKRSVSFGQVAGLWIVMAVAVLISVILLLCSMVFGVTMGGRAPHDLEGGSSTFPQQVRAPKRTPTAYHRHATGDLESGGGPLCNAVRMEIRDQMRSMSLDVIQLFKEGMCEWRREYPASTECLDRPISVYRPRETTE
ncbi:unnamed protein product [Ostreobium quekettii]|uniref:Ionotropic glutamate receptor C-terminal domain-containing protein n=1 Tax=Ostreobium quekettii TaxID=121088 RepID=A0A8S1JAW2_9CHLO|nr:unnamed protein product [Ostreobium quekettii]|eukprot:evm.model.scf_1046.4 EVM.evm.TU.scf_1046.4   scf_1046:40902-45140(-)